MPKVSIIVPCFNEEKTIGLLLDAIDAQDFPKTEMEVVIADGCSTDQTREVIRAYQNDHPELIVKLVDNIKRVIPSGLNRAVEAASGEYLVRMDAHSVPGKNYVSRSVANLDGGLGDNVGGVWEIQPGGAGWAAHSIAVAAAHPLGVGDARYRVGGKAQKVETVPFGAFRQSLIKEIGPFDETLLSNEDYEFNARIRKSGGTIWLDPEIRSKYFARSSFLGLARQYWRYGYWKFQMLRRYPETLRWRQGLPPLFVSSLFVLFALSFIAPLLGWLLIFELGLYGLILLIAGFRASITKRDIGLIIGLPVSIMLMHISWGTAFLWSMMKSFVQKLGS